MTDLDELVAKGRDKRREAKDDEARAQRETERDVDRETRNRLYASVSGYAQWAWWTYPLVLAIGIATVTHVLGNEDGDGSAAIVFIVGIPGLVIAYALRSSFGRSAVERNVAKLRALPFSVSGYVAALSSNRTEGTAKLVIRFTGETKTTAREHATYRAAGAVIEAAKPDDGFLADAFFAIGAKLTDESRKDHAKVVEWEISGGESSFSTNAHLDRFIWRAIDVLTAMHARYPLASLEINGFR